MKRLIILSLTLVLLAGCGVYRKYERSELPAENLFLNSETQDTATIATIPWQEFFTDTHLRALIEQGLRQNTDFRVARLRVEAAEAVLRNARLAYLPAISLNPEASVSQFDGSRAKSYNLAVAANWEIDLFGKVTNAKRGARSALEQSRTYRQAVQTQLVATIANSYYTLLMLDNQLAISRQTYESWTETERTLEALKRAGVTKEELSAVAFTRGPGLMGSLLVGVSFAKGFARSLGIPLIDVNHLTGHVLAHFIKAEGEENIQPKFPFLCLLVSGGNSQIILVKAYNDMEILGQTIDDAAGEAIDKCSKVMGLGYPGGPIIDKLARQGNPKAYTFSKPHIPGLDYSFSGLKTSFLYSLRDWMKDDPDFIEHHKVDLAASLEATVVDILMDKLRKAAKEYKIKEVAVAGGVSANNGLRNSFREHAEKYGWNIFIPKFSYTTDNAAMIAITGYFKYLDKDFCSIDLPAYSRVTL